MRVTCVSGGTRRLWRGRARKSQLAIEYGYRTHEQSPATWVFWVHGSNAARFEKSFRDIAEYLKIPRRREPKANIYKLVYDWLCDGKNASWLLIVDNVDDATFLLKTQRSRQEEQGFNSADGTQQPLSTYLPQSQNGRVLITTRSREAARHLVEERDMIDVRPFDQTHASDLFKRKLGELGDSQDIVKLAAILEYMPLAIVQAAAYISQRAPRCSVRQYLEDFRKSDRKKGSLLNHEAGRLRRDWEAKNSIIISWQISFEHIRRIRPSATELLSFLSFFDRQGIPEYLLRGEVLGDIERESESESQAGVAKPSKEHSLPGISQDDMLDQEQVEEEAMSEGDEEDEVENDEDCKSIFSCDDTFQDDIQMLRDFSFMSINTTGKFEMHALVQLATRKWLESKGQLEPWKERYIKILSIAFPSGEYETWSRCRELLPHAKSAIAQRPQAQQAIIEWASLLYNAGWYACKQRDFAEAEQLSTMAMEARKEIFGEEHKATLDSMSAVASVHYFTRRMEDAEKLAVQVMDIRRKVFGDEDPDTLVSMQNLAMTYVAQGRYKKADELGLRVLEVRRRALGEEHPDTLNSLSGLALSYRRQKRWKEAEELGLQAFEIRKRVLGEEHPDTVYSLSGLALSYLGQERWKEAEELGLQAFETRKRVLGEEHPDTIVSMYDLALVWRDQSRVAEAIQLMRDCLRLDTRILGSNHPNTLKSSEALTEWLNENSSTSIYGPSSRLDKAWHSITHPEPRSETLRALAKWIFRS
ncbi:uncharacterized protein KY384_000446 [Bacidia gigantensis]|uniref:uncharacterized protein n=1 Tax=Bacidia gigantensis TaxID=2732470 RepID=UPI001D0549B1|nr:uncharacterized protein KY384_000446 [Bacidia gigantensis]KAG8525686.1 hypothetical protein KY384_000446 [Bacidia gigantensis]